MSRVALSVEGLSVAVAGREVLSDITFDVRQGEYLGLVGPNGSGKSTLIKSMLGIMPVSSGVVKIFGKEGCGHCEGGHVGYLPQKIAHFNPFFPATVREIVSLGLFARGVSRAAGRAAVDEALRLMDIEPIANKLIGDLSGGQQQRAFLARSIVNMPDILFLDEPTTALDPETRERFYALLGNLNKEKGTTVILVTHDIGSIGQFASHLLYLDRSVIFHGGFASFCESPEMRKYFGEYSQHVICHRHD